MRKTFPAELRREIAAALPGFLITQRWFGGKARQIASVEITDVVPMRHGSGIFVLLSAVHYADSMQEIYSLPVQCAAQIASPNAETAVLLRTRNPQNAAPLFVMDAAATEELANGLLDTICTAAAVRGESGELRAFQSSQYARLCKTSDAAFKPRVLTGEQSNTSIVLGDRLILKFFRRLEEGINPDLELGAFLTEKADFPHVPQVAGYVEYRTPDGNQMTQAVLQTFVPNQGDAWRYTLKSLEKFYADVATDSRKLHIPTSRDIALDHEMPERLKPSAEPYLSSTALLAKRTAELHLALSSDTSDPEFAPEPFTPAFQAASQDAVLQLTKNTFELLRRKVKQLPAEWPKKAEMVLGLERQIIERFQAVLRNPIQAMRTRIHGDYHLGQVLYTGSDFVIIDFEGEPARSLAERRMKRSPLQDVAGMIRSFHYAAFAPLLGATGAAATTADLQRLTPWAQAWSGWVTKRFLAEYFKQSGSAPYLPSSENETTALLHFHLLEKAIYELRYELNNRPNWVGIPLEGIAQLLSA